jgi:hypothetical protein
MSTFRSQDTLQLIYAGQPWLHPPADLAQFPLESCFEVYAGPLNTSHSSLASGILASYGSLSAGPDDFDEPMAVAADVVHASIARHGAFRVEEHPAMTAMSRDFLHPGSRDIRVVIAKFNKNFADDAPAAYPILAQMIGFLEWAVIAYVFQSMQGWNTIHRGNFKSWRNRVIEMYLQIYTWRGRQTVAGFQAFPELGEFKRASSATCLLSDLPYSPCYDGLRTALPCSWCSPSVAPSHLEQHSRMFA